MISSVSLTATHLAVFINRKLSPLVANVETDYVATGFKNTIGNKGGVMIKFDLVDSSVVCINSHLHSGLDGVAKRNNDVKLIMSKFIYGGKAGSSK